jgi:hypothetical protein
VSLNFVLVPVYGMWAAAWTTVIGFGILAVLVFFISNKWYPIPYEWRRLITLGTAAALTLVAAWAIGLAAGVEVHEPLRDLLLGQLAMTPALLVFPLVLWLARFFTPRERTMIGGLWRRLTGRRGETAAVKVAPAVPAAAVAGGTLGATGAVVAGLSEDEIEAELEETEIELEVDIAEGGSTQT